MVGTLHPHWLVAAIAGVAGLLLEIVYFAGFWSLEGQTPGMRLMRLRVLGPDGSRPASAARCCAWSARGCAIVPLFAGFLPVLVDDRRRALQDFIAGTIVVNDAVDLIVSAAPALSAPTIEAGSGAAGVGARNASSHSSLRGRRAPPGGYSFRGRERDAEARISGCRLGWLRPSDRRVCSTRRRRGRSRLRRDARPRAARSDLFLDVDRNLDCRGTGHLRPDCSQRVSAASARLDRLRSQEAGKRARPVHGRWIGEGRAPGVGRRHPRNGVKGLSVGFDVAGPSGKKVVAPATACGRDLRSDGQGREAAERRRTARRGKPGELRHADHLAAAVGGRDHRARGGRLEQAEDARLPRQPG